MKGELNEIKNNFFIKTDDDIPKMMKNQESFIFDNSSKWSLLNENIILQFKHLKLILEKKRKNPVKDGKFISASYEIINESKDSMFVDSHKMKNSQGAFFFDKILKVNFKFRLDIDLSKRDSTKFDFKTK